MATCHKSRKIIPALTFKKLRGEGVLVCVCGGGGGGRTEFPLLWLKQNVLRDVIINIQRIGVL